MVAREGGPFVTFCTTHWYPPEFVDLRTLLTRVLNCDRPGTLTHKGLQMSLTRALHSLVEFTSTRWGIVLKGNSLVSNFYSTS